jgi:superoxide dismutase, Cu-Zn family
MNRQMNKRGNRIAAILIILLVPLIGFSQMEHKMGDTKAMTGRAMKAICVVYPTQGNSVTGLVTFLKTEAGIKVIADIHGLTKGKHGFHIHEFGDCSSADGSSAGGHFNPASLNHGGPMDKMRHMGDMGNLDADESGNAHLEYVDPMISLEGENSVIGKSVIVHKNEDDLKSQPVGNAGPRVACGVIGLAK